MPMITMAMWIWQKIYLGTATTMNMAELTLEHQHVVNNKKTHLGTATTTMEAEARLSRPLKTTPSGQSALEIVTNVSTIRVLCWRTSSPNASEYCLTVCCHQYIWRIMLCIASNLTILKQPDLSWSAAFKMWWARLKQVLNLQWNSVENREYISKHQIVISPLGRGCSCRQFQNLGPAMQTRADDFWVPVLWPSDTIIGRSGDRYTMQLPVWKDQSSFSVSGGWREVEGQ